MTSSLHFAQISDIHISSLGDYAEMLSGQAAEFLAQTIATLNRLDDLDFVLITGDLVNSPSSENIGLFQQVIQGLKKPYYIIPGNHDRRDPESSEGLTRHQFAWLFNPQVQDRPTEPEAQNGYWSVTINAQVQLIGLDSNRDVDWGGLVDPAQVAWLTAELETHADKVVIVAVHHPFHRLAPIDDLPQWRNFVCDNGLEMRALLDQYPQVKLVLTGHHHQTKADLLGQRLHLACPALAVFPCAYRTLRLTPLAGNKWQLEWQTHPVAPESTVLGARQKMLQAWTGAGFDLPFVETHAELTWGSEWDRAGMVEL
ncbi:MAG: metallophosphoesterase [Anaerolineae bacterium]